MESPRETAAQIDQELREYCQRFAVICGISGERRKKLGNTPKRSFISISNSGASLRGCAWPIMCRPRCPFYRCHSIRNGDEVFDYPLTARPSAGYFVVLYQECHRTWWRIKYRYLPSSTVQRSITTSFFSFALLSDFGVKHCHQGFTFLRWLRISSPYDIGSRQRLAVQAVVRVIVWFHAGASQ